MTCSACERWPLSITNAANLQRIESMAGSDTSVIAVLAQEAVLHQGSHGPQTVGAGFVGLRLFSLSRR